jgi:hypothetical protein
MMYNITRHARARAWRSWRAPSTSLAQPEHSLERENIENPPRKKRARAHTHTQALSYITRAGNVTHNRTMQ